MAVYKIANLNIEINPKTEYSANRLRSYINSGTENDFAVEVFPQDIEYELTLAEEGGDISAEFIAIFRKICKEILLNYNGMFLHSAAIKYKGKAYLFTAPSGTGKTTHIQLWKQYVGDSVEIINGDKPLLREEKGVINVYGTPWQGKEGLGSNTFAPLGGIIVLQRGLQNDITRVPVSEALKLLLSQTLRPANAYSVDKLLSFLSKILQTTPVFKLNCNISQDAVKAVLKAINEL